MVCFLCSADLQFVSECKEVSYDNSLRDNCSFLIFPNGNATVVHRVGEKHNSSRRTKGRVFAVIAPISYIVANQMFTFRQFTF